MAAGQETNDWLHHPLDSASNFASQAADELWTKAQSMSTGQWLAVGAVAAASIGAAGFTALRAAGLIGRSLTSATESALGLSAMSTSEDTIAAIARVTSKPASVLSDNSFTADPKLAKLFGPERTVVDLGKDNLRNFDPFRELLTVAEPTGSE